MPLLRVMIVEDEVLIRKYIASLLEELDCDVIGETGYGEEVRDLWESLKPDLILMDINLKGAMSGTDAAAKLAEVSDVPVLFMTAYDFAEKVEALALPNNFGYLTKPVAVSSLRPYIDRAAQKRTSV